MTQEAKGIQEALDHEPDTDPTFAQKLVSEAIGTFFLFSTLVGAGIMALNLADGNIAVALIGTTLPIGAILYVLIVIFGPISGAHMNPAVTLVMTLRGAVTVRIGLAFVAAQLVGGIASIWATHAMFDLPIWQVSTTVRTGSGQWLSEGIATFGLLFTILGCIRYKPDAIPAAVAFYIFAGCWFTSSTCFANPAITIARTITDTFVGISPADAPPFILAQIGGALTAYALASWLFRGEPVTA